VGFSNREIRPREPINPPVDDCPAAATGDVVVVVFADRGDID
jgi:hypothetical protein